MVVPAVRRCLRCRWICSTTSIQWVMKSVKRAWTMSPRGSVRAWMTCALTNRTSVRYTVHMLVQALPDTITKLSQIGDVTHFEPAGDQPQSERRRVPYQARSLADCITNVSTPGGKKPLL